ncbi:MAG TPA: bifunctional phosphoglucose/phosphomannose isomerase [Acidilobales archaeon]|nr:bifunctional phosphoglucose/phosphomannose isomerase [Acidilobales archaeon]
MLDQYLSWYDMALKALKYKIENFTTKPFSKIAICGMGGSGIVGDYLRVLASDRLNYPVTVIKDFNIPKWVDKETLVIGISYSGRTMETVSAVEKALRRGALIAVIASGGKLINLAKVKGLMYVKVDSGYVPRTSLPLLLYSALKIMKELNADIVSEPEIQESIDILKNYRSYLNYSLSLSSVIKDNVPIVITDPRYEPLCLRFKNEFNENSKIIAKCEIYPEWAHNDIVGYEGGVRNVKVILANPNDGSLYQKVFEGFMVPYLTSLGYEVCEVKLQGKCMLAKLIYGSLIAGLTSVLLAQRKGVDPLETRSIKLYKEYIKRVSTQFFTQH